MPFSQYLATAPAGEFFWWCAIPAGAALIALISGFTFLLRARLMENTPTSRLRSAAQGYIEVEGRASLMDGPPIICPLTVTRCVWWRYKVEEEQDYYDGKHRRKHWVTVERGLSDDSFLLTDPTGRCVVDPTGAQVIPTLKRVWYGRTRRPTVGPEAGKGFWRALFCDYRYTEELILAGNPVYALGAFRTQAGGPESGDEKADLTELLSKWKHDKKMMALLDVNKDGAVDVNEWEAARRMASQKVRQEHVQRAVETGDLHILAKPKDRRPFVLSGIPQAALIRRFRIYSGLSSAAAFGAGVFALWTLHLRGIL